MRLELKDITKRFPGVLANDRISISADRGEVLGLLGENGAGKSTLVNCVFGLYQPDEGTILVRGEQVQLTRPMKLPDAKSPRTGDIACDEALFERLRALQPLHRGLPGEGPGESASQGDRM